MTIDNRVFKTTTLVSVSAVIVSMMAATVLEKIYGSQLAFRLIYHNPVFFAFWALAAVSGLVLAYRSGMQKRIPVLTLHLAFVMMLAGALTTFLTSENGRLHLRESEVMNYFADKDMMRADMPFSIELKQFQIEYYAGTESPMDYSSFVTVTDGDRQFQTEISMNHPLKYRGYRFYQSSYDPDMKGSTLAVSHDPWGVAISYTGYFLLMASLIGFFFVKQSGFRAALARLSKRAAVILLLMAGTHASAATTAGKVIPADLAEQMGTMLVYYNGRVAPLETLARDYVMKVYGKPGIEGYSAMQVFTGWMFHYDTWSGVPVKLKKKERGQQIEEEKHYLVRQVASQRVLKIFMIDGQWYSPADHLPESVAPDEWTFMRSVLSLVAEHVFNEEFSEASQVIEKLKLYQQKNAKEILPSAFHMKAEHLYNQIGRPMVPAMALVTLGMILFVMTGIFTANEKRIPHAVVLSEVLIAIALSVYLTTVLGLRWYVQHHIPMASGFEMMMLIAWCAMLAASVFIKRLPVLAPMAFILTGFALLVAVLGESNPQITPLMPVLSSPLLAIHVACMMISYTMFGLVALNGIMGMAIRNRNASRDLADISLVIIYPAVFLLTTGTFLGAIWANVSWGSYWSWDPKETWALITILVYSFSLHGASLPKFRNPRFIHLFTIISFICVLITYFGVNLILGGMHSYA